MDEGGLLDFWSLIQCVHKISGTANLFELVEIRRWKALGQAVIEFLLNHNVNTTCVPFCPVDLVGSVLKS